MAEKTTPGQIPEADRPSIPTESEEKGSDDKEEKDQKEKTRRRPLGQRRGSIEGKGIAWLRAERRKRKEMVRQMNVLGVLPHKKPKPKPLGKKALKKKMREEREVLCFYHFYHFYPF